MAFVWILHGFRLQPVVIASMVSSFMPLKEPVLRPQEVMKMNNMTKVHGNIYYFGDVEKMLYGFDHYLTYKISCRYICTFLAYFCGQIRLYFMFYSRFPV